MVESRMSPEAAIPAQPTSRTAEHVRSFGRFFADEHRRLFRALYLVTGSAQEAEEVAQDAFLKVWERWERVSAMEEPTGYLYRTALNAVRSRARRAARMARRTLPGRAEPPRDLFAEAEERDMVARALRGLAPRQRAALVLTELLEFGSEEAGRLLGVTAGTVRALASQGRAALRGALEASDE